MPDAAAVAQCRTTEDAEVTIPQAAHISETNTFTAMVRYDTIECLTWTRKLSIELYLPHVARKRN